ncbi:MAG TPA: hypothetical protein PK659_10140 [Methanothrix sp.]|mgnify:FL=1|nr:hypothetical protein [Methanothrix sp.]HOL44601.1 hypothetical protein [Methanothrix sp.]
MPETNFVKFKSFISGFAKGEHCFGKYSDAIKVYLSNTAPSAGEDTVKSDIPGITEQNGYHGSDLVVSWDIDSESGVAMLLANDVVYMASGGSFGPFRYVILYNDSHEDDALICFADLGEEITVQSGDGILLTFPSPVLTVE